METLSLFQELEDPKVALKAAIKADVDSSGGCKEIAIRLWPDLDPIKATQKLSNACNPKQKQELDYHDIQKVKVFAREITGASHVHAHESKQLNCELHWITLQEEAQRVAVNLSEVARSFSATMAQAQIVLNKLAAATSK